MQQLICLLLLILFPLKWMKAQSSNLLSERIYQEWSEESSSWENIRKWTNKFDQEERLTETGNYEWFQNNWRPLSITQYVFNDQGQQIHYKGEIWGTTFETYDRQYMYEADFSYGENGEPVGVDIVETEFPSGLTRKTTLEYRYNDRNIRYETRGNQINYDGSESMYIYQLKFNSYGQITSNYILNWSGLESLTSYSYSTAGCRMSVANRERYQGTVWNLLDSTYTVIDKNCQILGEEFYTGRGETFILKSMNRYTYGKNENGQLNFYSQEIRLAGEEDWSLVYQYETDYNSYGNPVLNYFIYPDRVLRSKKAYDDKQRLILELTDQSTSKTGEYLPASVNEVVYGEDDLVISNYSALEWNEVKSRYEVEYITLNTWTEEFSQSEYYQRNYLDFQRSVSRFYSDCEGNYQSITDEITASSNPGETGKKARELYRYVNRPECAMATFREEPLVLFPNPASQYIDIVLPNQEVIGKITISDTSGRIIKSYLHNVYGNHTRIDVSGLNAGIYILYVGSGKAIAAKRFEIYN